MQLTLGPLLYYWPRARLGTFHDAIAAAPVDRVYLGEAVCSRRHEYRTADWLDQSASAIEASLPDWMIMPRSNSSTETARRGSMNIREPSARQARSDTGTGCDGVIVGRGCLGRPWLFRDLSDVFAGREPQNPPTLGEVRDVLVERGARREAICGGAIGRPAGSEGLASNALIH